MSMLPCVDEISCLSLHPLKSGPPTLPLVQREFRTNEGDDDFATIPEVTLSGDFTIDVLVFFTGVTFVIFGDPDNFFTTSRINPDGSIRWRPVGNSAEVLSPAGSVVANRLSVLSFSRADSVAEIKVGGIIVVTGGTSTAPIVIKSIFNSGGALTGGILANLKIYDAGTLIRNYPINDGKNILANAATALGSELDGLTYAPTTVIGGVASVVLSSLSVIGKTYLVEVSYSGVVGDASVRIGGFSGPSFTGAGSHSFVATAITTVNDILGALTGVTSGSVTVSIKEAEGYGTIINGNADDWGLFDKQANGDWKGNGLAVPPWDSADQVLVVA